MWGIAVRHRAAAAGAAVLALAAGLTACTGGSDDDGESRTPGAVTASPVAGRQACTNGTYTWTNVGQTKRMTGITRPEPLGKGGGSLTYQLSRVYTPHQSVEGSGPALSSAEVLYALGKKTGVIDSDVATLAEDDGMTYSFTDVTAKAPALNPGVTDSVGGAGRIVQYAYVVEVAGDFRYSCADGGDVLGHAVGWKIDGHGIIDCDHSIDGPAGDTALARSAAVLACTPGSAALKTA
ncbi:hypothetical protein ABZ490_33620 [Streptomyces sp. NPDC005811]|uniref:hypothetical protein n=1 Tax=Streptomyces sp. NPDC005811 TaxID=3154565 RepID=UPI00340FD8AF